MYVNSAICQPFILLDMIYYLVRPVGIWTSHLDRRSADTRVTAHFTNKILHGICTIVNVHWTKQESRYMQMITLANRLSHHHFNWYSRTWDGCTLFFRSLHVCNLMINRVRFEGKTTFTSTCTNTAKISLTYICYLNIHDTMGMLNLL